jgi:hypothetical protein
MAAWFWIPIGTWAWLCASLGVGVFASRVAALATPDGTLLMWREPELLKEACHLKPRSAR